MKTLLAIILLLLMVGSAIAKDKHEYQVGTFLGTQMLADGTYTNDIHCGSGQDYTCTGAAGFNGIRAYYVRMDNATLQMQHYPHSWLIDDRP